MALIGAKRVAVLGVSRPPSFVPAGDSAYLDFRAAQYWVQNGGQTLATMQSTLRSSSRLVQNADGSWFSVGQNTLGVGTQGAPTAVGRTNKCTNYNANPTDLTNVTKSGDAAAVLSVVDDSATLAAAGLSQIATSGKVYKLDNSAGSTNANAVIGGNTGSTNAHALSVFWRGTGSGLLRLASGEGQITVSMGPSYIRSVSQNVAPGASTRAMYVSASAGSVVYFILNQLEEGSFATSPIVVAGAAATRYADNVSLIGALSTLLGSTTGTIIIEVGTGAFTSGAFLLGGGGSSDYYIAQGSDANHVKMRAGGSTVATALIGGGKAIGTDRLKIAISWDGTTIGIAANGGTEANAAQAVSPPTNWYLGGSNGSSMSTLYFERLRFRKASSVGSLASLSTP